MASLLAALIDFGLSFEKAPILCDSINVISVVKNHILHSGTKNIDVCRHDLRDHFRNGDMDLCQVAHKLLIQPLDQQTTFASLRWELNVCFPF